MEVENAGLAEAIRTLNGISEAGAVPEIESVGCRDGKGGELLIPVAMLPSGPSKIEAHSLLGVLEAGTVFARKQRLADAPGPDSRTGTAALQSLASFIAHGNRFKAENSAIWADAAARRLVSVLDYHPAGAESPARWGRHRGTYQCPLSEAWTAWGGGDVLEVDQDGLAALLDSRDRELTGGKLPSGSTAPEPAYLITMASKLEVYSNANAKRERDPNTGRLKISYVEEKGLSGDIVPPPSFLVFIPVFQDAEPQVLEVRLRVTVENAKAHFEVQLHAAADILRDAFTRLCGRVEVETALPLFCGTPEP